MLDGAARHLLFEGDGEEVDGDTAEALFVVSRASRELWDEHWKECGSWLMQ